MTAQPHSRVKFARAISTRNVFLAETALGERTFRERVLEDVAGAERAGAQGTPTFFVDGERLEGPWRRLAQIVPAKIEESRR